MQQRQCLLLLALATGFSNSSSALTELRRLVTSHHKLVMLQERQWSTQTFMTNVSAPMPEGLVSGHDLIHQLIWLHHGQFCYRPDLPDDTAEGILSLTSCPTAGCPL